MTPEGASHLGIYEKLVFRGLFYLAGQHDQVHSPAQGSRRVKGRKKGRFPVIFRRALMCVKHRSFALPDSFIGVSRRRIKTI